jgi:hypothetical protein
MFGDCICENSVRNYIRKADVERDFAECVNEKTCPIWDWFAMVYMICSHLEKIRMKGTQNR